MKQNNDSLLNRTTTDTLKTRYFVCKQGNKCTSGACLPAHKCQQSWTDILDFDLATIFTLFILRTIFVSVLEKV